MVSFYKGHSAFEEFSLIDLTFEQLVESDFHIGSKISRFEKLNFNYIFAKRFDVLIMNLFYGLYNLKMAIYFLTFIVSRRGKILFFDSLEGMRNFVEFIGVTSKQYYISQKWIAGLLTNFKNFYPAVFTGISRHFKFSEYHYSGMRYIHRPPNVSCLLNLQRGSSAFFENFRLGIPVISLVRSDDVFSGVTFPVFANNSSAFTYFTFFMILRSSILNGYKDEIYKFYRKGLKKNLKLRYLKLSKKTHIRNTIVLFFREYFLDFFFSNSLFISYFFFFIKKQLLNDSFFSKFILEVLKDLFYFFDKHLFQFNYIYSPYKDFISFELSSFNEKFNLERLLNDYSFFNKVIKIIIFFFFLNDHLKSSVLFFDRFFSVFYFFLKKFVYNINSQGLLLISIRRLNFFFLFFRIWCSYNLKRVFIFSDYEKNVTHEIFPFFNYVTTESNFSAGLFYKILFFKIKTYGFFTGSGLKFFTMKTFAKLKRHFFKVNSFKFNMFSKEYKTFFRTYNRRLKFFQFLNKSIFYGDYVNKGYINKFYKKNSKSSTYSKSSFFKDLNNRIKLNSASKATMLEYFDEEFDDFKFPVNNQFFFFQAAYGSAFLTRQYLRNKIIYAQKHSSVVVKNKRRKSLKIKGLVRLQRSILFFRFFNKI